MHLNNVRSRINEPKELVKLLLHLAVPILIIHVQGDDGTAIIYAIIGCCMMFAAGLSWKYILGAVSAAAVAMATAFAFFSDKIGKGYQWYRILAVIDPENSTGWAPNEATWKNIIYQQQRGEIALGSGGIFGNGLFTGRYYSVPNAHNDFILSWIGNAAGFVGCCVVLGVLFALVIKTFLTGVRSEDLLGTFICAGIGGRSAGPDRRERGHEPARPACDRCHPAVLFGGRQLGADAVHLCGPGALGLYPQHKKAVRLSRNRTRPRREGKTLRGRFCVSAKGIAQLVGKPFQQICFRVSPQVHPHPAHCLEQGCSECSENAGQENGQGSVLQNFVVTLV